MSKLYIFAIGGSGSRVLRSLTMLLASGVHSDSDIIPIIIDPDASNGDLNRTVNVLRQYEGIRNQLKYDSDLKNNFFSAYISSLNKNQNYLMPLDGTADKNYDRYLGLASMSQENQAMAKMLFSNHNLSSTMNVGFKGNPNVGSVVLNQFTESQTFKDFENNFVAGDKIFIISSIFGGTGASGFPLILKTLRTSTNNALKSAQIGAVSLLPYFNLKTDDNSSIQADSFITKTKAALNYYEKNVTGNGSLNEMYYLGDDFNSQSYDNCEGGDGQSNDAHFIELLAALAVLDFDRKQIGVVPMPTSFHEYGLRTNNLNGSILFSDLGDQTLSIVKKPLSMMAILNSYLNNRDINHRINQKWAKDKKSILGASFFNGAFFENYKNFKKEFEEWISELEDNQVSFAPFNKDSEVHDGLEKIKGVKPNYSSWNPFGKKGYDLIDEMLGKNISKIPASLSAQVTFMEVFHRTISEICSNNLNIK